MGAPLYDTVGDVMPGHNGQLRFHGNLVALVKPRKCLGANHSSIGRAMAVLSPEFLLLSGGTAWVSEGMNASVMPG